MYMLLLLYLILGDPGTARAGEPLGTYS